MEREVLLLLPLPAGVDSDSALVRRLFERWWQGAAAVALGGAEGWPVPFEQRFAGVGVSLTLRTSTFLISILSRSRPTDHPDTDHNEAGSDQLR